MDRRLASPSHMAPMSLSGQPSSVRAAAEEILGTDLRLRQLAGLFHPDVHCHCLLSSMFSEKLVDAKAQCACSAKYIDAGDVSDKEEILGRSL